MSAIHGRYGPTHPLLGALRHASRIRCCAAMPRAMGSIRRTASLRANVALDFAEKLRCGERVYLAGIGPAGHNSGVALVEVSRADGIRLICNNEEERYSGIRHCTTLPEQSLHAMQTMLDDAGIDRADPCLCRKLGLRHAGRDAAAQHRRGTPSQPCLPPAAELCADERTPYRARVPLAPAAWAAAGAGPRHADHRHAPPRQPRVLLLCGVAVCRQRRTGDGQRARRHRRRWRDLALPGAGASVTLVHRNRDIFDSLGGFYSMLSSTQGGWTILSSEGRYMGCAAWGDGERLTNPLLSPAARAVPFHQRRHGAAQPRAGQLAAQPAGATLHQGAA